MPFSTRRTCQLCHSYEIISAGWHFNAADPNLSTEQHFRQGQPWILIDRSAATQVPLSYRPWPQAFKPDQFGITPWKFLELFGSHMPGGGIGELDGNEPAEIMRQMVSGKLEINCLACHNAHPGQDQAEFAAQIARQNYRWAATAASELAIVTGIAAAQDDIYDYQMSDDIAVRYNPHRFGYRDRVLLDIVGKVPNYRCYFCHSNHDIGIGEKWSTDQDVHLAAGLTCVDCHRNGLDHKITRGYEGESTVSDNPLADALTCKACHLGGTDDVGRLGAPKPKHTGMPTIHFEKLTCTACHSGLRPADKTHLTKTARAHRLGTDGVNRSDDALPHINYPVFATEQGSPAAYASQLLIKFTGKIGPHKLLWPAYWATLQDEKVAPIDLKIVRPIVSQILPQQSSDDSGSWLPVTDEQITAALKQIPSEAAIEGQPVYIAGARLHQLSDSGNLVSDPHPAAAPYTWPLAHDVRPAAQSLGSAGCGDCHSIDAPIFFGKVVVDSPLASDKGASIAMIQFQDLDPLYTKAFALSFVFRPWLKATIIACSCVLSAVLILYALRALAAITGLLGGEKPAPAQQSASQALPKPLRVLKALAYLATALALLVLALTGFYPLLILRQNLTGYLLIIHVTAGGVFAACLTILAVMSAHNHRFTSGRLLRKLCFWIIVLSALPLSLSIALSMFPLFGTTGQFFMADTHIYSAYVFSAAAVLHTLLSIRTRPR